MHTSTFSLRIFLSAFAISLPATLPAAESPLEHFEKHIRPVLVKKCAECHSGKTPDGNLDLLTKDGFSKGGITGAVVDGRDAHGSQLFERITSKDEDISMPPGERLSESEIAAFRTWIENGSPWPEHDLESDHSSDDVSHWSFQPVSRPAVPEAVADPWCQNDIDAFALHEMRAAGVEPSPNANPQTWLRRLCLDLTGLPPSLDQQAALAAAIETDSLAEFEVAEIERLLVSRACAERQARHWLDAARYADTSGDGTDTPIPEARYYRDWVIDAFQNDMPYDRFVIEQIAGDILAAQNPDSPEAFRSIIATGYIALSRRFGNSRFAEMHQIIDDTIDTIGKSTMGLTLGCARCHHHKFDPVTQEDYYSLYGYFSSTQYPHAGTEHQKERSDLPTIKVPEQQKDRYESTVAWAVSDKEKVGDARLHIAGEPNKKGDTIRRAFIGFLSEGDTMKINEKSSGRLELAKRIASPDNPLFARVMVNRIWQSHFGEGIVTNESNFGRQTPQPHHHKLLDYLANELIDSGWSTRHIHRLILTSHVYRQSSAASPNGLAVDEANQLLWHFPRTRMSAETLRDSMLFVSGELEEGDGGRHPFKATKDLKYSQGRPFAEIFDHNRRSIYLMTPRLNKHPMLAMFDGADANKTTMSRGESTVPLQALFFINGEFVSRQSSALATRVTQSTSDTNQRIETLWKLALARTPTSDEAATVAEYLSTYSSELKEDGKSTDDAEHTSWTSVARSLLSSNEFVYVD